MTKATRQFCGGDYLPDRSTQRFCSKVCSDRWWAAERRRGVEMLRNARLGPDLAEPAIEGPRKIVVEPCGGDCR